MPPQKVAANRRAGSGAASGLQGGIGDDPGTMAGAVRPMPPKPQDAENEKKNKKQRFKYREMMPDGQA